MLEFDKSKGKRFNKLKEALDFLISIPLASEHGRTPQGTTYTTVTQDSYAESRNTNVNVDSAQSDGPSVSVQMGSRRQCEWHSHPTRNSGILRGVGHRRVYVSAKAPKAYPVATFSVLGYTNTENSKRKSKHNDDNESKPKLRFGGVSYSHLLIPQPEYAPIDSFAGTVDEFSEILPGSFNDGPLAENEPPSFQPFLLDNSEITQGTQHITAKRSGYVFSVIPYMRKKQMKKDLNKQFAELHPWLDPSITLSKIRNLKMEVLECAVKLDLELSTVALSHIYFEKLIFLEKVSKANRKVTMAACMTLAFKFSEPKTVKKKGLNALLGNLEHIIGISRKSIQAAEFEVLVNLELNLHVSAEVVWRYFEKILQDRSIVEKEYLEYEFEELHCIPLEKRKSGQKIM
eukprot:TRINITY_DN47237_c0_g1_i1.p1 TRINITY_DN47237_c0_g1~~TRINITY_DN47237_c0_g1_i1.p1  ORF type:complete len:402 (-),score=75.79 TRINITY_DN47237_c0_g1_i1:91-1296(-)